MSSNSNSLPRKDSLILMLDASNRFSYNNIVGKDVEILVVGGGGGGGMDIGGGGGGGEVIYQTYTISSVSGINVVVGAGGRGAPAGGTYRSDGAGPQPGGHQFTIPATDGEFSSFGTVTAYGGGYGGSSYWGYTPNYGYGHDANGAAGGGGASGYSDGNTGRGGANTSGIGFNGGGSLGQYYSGGGAGAGSNGGGFSNVASNGGAGKCFPQMSPYYFGGGGGGAGHSTSGGNGGIGGGGGGADYYYGPGNGGAGLNNGSSGQGAAYNGSPGGNGGANTGGGGGGGSHYNTNNKGGEGGSGIVIVRYKGIQAATGGTVSFKDGYTYHTFLSTGTFTPYSTSSTWYDQSKYQNHFTGQGTFTVDEFGSISGFTGNSLGNGNKFYRSSFPSNLKLSQGGNGLTVLVWARCDGGSSWRKLIGNGDGENYIDLFKNPSGYWAQDNSLETLYVDGVQVSSGTYYMPSAGWHLYGATNSNLGSLTNPTYALTIGNEPNSSPQGTNAYPWVGAIAAVMIYNVVLDPAEMREIYNAQKSRFNII